MKRTVVAVVCGLLAILAALGALVYFAPVMTVKAVEVEGNAQVSFDEAVEASGVREGMNIVRVDTTEAARRLAELDWVEEASVSRSLPSTVSLELVEHVAVAHAGDELIDAEGETFATGEPPEGAVELRGEAGEDARRAVVEALAEIDPETRGQVAFAEAPSSAEILLGTHDGREVFWGASEDNGKKARALRVVLAQPGERWDISNPELVSRIGEAGPPPEEQPE